MVQETAAMPCTGWWQWHVRAAATQCCAMGFHIGGETMKTLLALVILVLSLASACADQVEDEAAIRAIQARWDEAWNRHDIQALSTLVADDVRFVNVAGQVLKSRAEFQQLQTRTHAMMFKDSVRTVTATQIKFITPEIAIAHVSWGMRGDKDPDGTARQPRNGVMMQVLVKRDGKWIVVAAQNTNARRANPEHQ
jgi:uncharacterized protein (TIGR02246 family)